MVMAKSSEKKSTFVKPSGFLKKHWWKVGISLLFLFGLVSFGYEKYLDRQNVTDMKQLLADIKQLEKTVESETGGKIFIKSSCSSVGKFATSYACYVSLEPNDGLWSDILTKAVMNHTTSLLKEFGDCRMLSDTSSRFKKSEDSYNCSLTVRNSNIDSAKRIFY